MSRRNEVHYFREFKNYFNNTHITQLENELEFSHWKKGKIESSILNSDGSHFLKEFDMRQISSFESHYFEAEYGDSDRPFKKKTITGLYFLDVDFSRDNIEIENMESIVFKDCVFRACSFENIGTGKKVDLGTLRFENCEFTPPMEAVKKYPYRSGHEMNYFGDCEVMLKFFKCDMKACFLHGNIRYFEAKECKINNMVFNNLIIRSLILISSEIINSTLIDFEFNRVNFINCNFISTHLLPNESEIENSDLYKSGMSLTKAYRNISNNFGNENEKYLERTYFLMAKLTASYPPFSDKGVDSGSKFEKLFHFFILPTRILQQMLSIIALFSILYLFIGLRESGSNVVLFSILDFDFRNISFYGLIDILKNLYQSLYFSCLTFTTVGYGDLVIRKWFEALPMIEMFTGVAYFGIFTGSIFKRYVD